MKKIIKETFFQRIVLPAMLAIILFIISVFVFIIPAFENSALQQKRNMLHELTNTAWSILNKYHLDEQSGILTTHEAQQKAKAEVESLRYGADKKDYFWITDLQPAMVMHPYVHELNGKSLNDYADPDGKKLFIEAVKIAQQETEGFISYKWQFKDDAMHIVPKLSFVKKFEPWGWIIGTGIYLNDVQTEMSSLTNKMILILLAIILIISLIISFIAYQSLHIETQRKSAEKQLRESREKYKSLIESSTEGVILLLNSNISYTNSYIQNWLQYSSADLLSIPLKDLFRLNQMPDFENVKCETRVEIDLVRKNGSVAEAVLTILPVKFADKEGLLLTFRDTSDSRLVKTELELLKNRLQFISEKTHVSFFRINNFDKKHFVEFSINLVKLLAYHDEKELKKIKIFEIFESISVLKKIIKEIKEKQVISSKKIMLRRKDNSLIEVYLHLSLNVGRGSNQYACEGMILPIEINTPLLEKDRQLAHSLSTIFSQSLYRAVDFIKPIVSCPADSTLQALLEVMTRNHSTYILLSIHQEYVGIITRNDIIERALIESFSFQMQAIQLMTSPIITIDESYSLSDAHAIFENRKISHLLIKNSDNKCIGILDKESLIGLFINPAEQIKKAIEHAKHSSEFHLIKKQIPSIIKPMLNEFSNIQAQQKFITITEDSITHTIINNVIKELGEPPVSFAFISLGSAGREELTFNSDQDNAIIFEENIHVSKELVQSYFLSLSEKVCRLLDEAGIPYCSGGYMASNPKWCQPIGVWKKYFKEWIVNAEPENILNISVFFDLRLMYGNDALFKELEDYIYEMLDGRTAFFYFLAQSVVSFKPPLNVFGNIVTGASQKNNEAIDIKNCLAQTIMFARIYALHNKVRPKNTIGRIELLKNMGVLSTQTADEIHYHYNYLMRHRMLHQMRLIENRMEMNNLLTPKKLPEIEQMILKKVLSQMSGYQEKLSATFMSAYKG